MKDHKPDNDYYVFLAIRKIICDLDPMGFVDFCGEEEYDTEVKDIQAQLVHLNTAEELKNMVIRVITKSFDDAGDHSHYDETGQKLLEVKKKYNL